MEMQQTHYYTTGTATLPWKCTMVHRSCYQGKPNMSQYIYIAHCREIVSITFSQSQQTDSLSRHSYFEVLGDTRSSFSDV
jgi:hypothetical protein